MWIRIWRKNAILCDLTLNEQGHGTWITRPKMPDNDHGTPNLQIDPWAQLIRHGLADVEEYGQAADPGD